VTTKGELPAPMVIGDTELIVGAENPPAGVERVSGSEFDVPSELDTDTLAVPASAVSAAGTEAVSCVALTKVVALAKVVALFDIATPFQFTSASLVKFVPFTVSKKPWVLHYGVEVGEVADADSEAIAGGVPGAAPIVKRTTFDISVVVVLLTFEVGEEAEPGIWTATCTVPAVARSEAGTGAVS